MRCFIGVPVPLEMARVLAERAAHAPVPMERTRLLIAEDLHLTLRFFGELAGARVASLGAALLPLRQPAFRLDLTGVGAFRSVGALYAAVAPSIELEGLAEAVDERLAWHGFPRELRPFHPHVTLARVRRTPAQTELDRWSGAWTQVSFVADRLALFHSRERVGTSLREQEAGVGAGPASTGGGSEQRYEIARIFNFG